MPTDSSSPTVLVLGAGFTRAFLPSAPLLVDDYNLIPLLEKFKPFPYATTILERELSQGEGGSVDIERLMTRLYGRMPYDRERGAEAELSLLLSDVKERFLARLKDSRQGAFYQEEMAALASWCVENAVDCVTFNYDDVFDQKLWEVKKVMNHIERPYWHPDGGYGFFCKPSLDCVRQTLVFKDETSMRLFKLHGSLNWRGRRGSQLPYGTNDLVHHEDWLPTTQGADIAERESVEPHLAQEPFIVPPVLAKSNIVEEPLLSLVWWLAHQTLEAASQVVFVGYSLPTTDLAARFLFGEALGNKAAEGIRVVNFAQTDEDKSVIRDRYRSVIPKLPDDHFDFGGALEWSRALGGEDAPPK